MSRTTHRAGLFVVMLIMLASIVAACGSPATTGSSTTGEAQPTAAPAAEAQPTAAPATAGEPSTVTFWVPSGFAEDISEELIAEFEQANPDLTLDVVTSPQSDYYQKLQTAFQAGSPPDVMALQPFFNMPTFAKAGWLEPLSERAKGSTVLDLDTLYQPEVYKYEGELYSVPLTTNLWRIGYNKKVYDELGLKPPTTWDELMANVKATTRDTDGDGKNDQYGWGSVLYEDSWAVYYYGNFLAMNDAYLVKPGATESGAADQASKETLEFFTTLNKEYGPPGGVTMNADQLAAAFTQGKVAHFAMGSWWESTLKPLGFEYKRDYDSFANPAGPSRKSSPTAAVGDVWTWSLAATGKNVEGGWRLLEFLARPETRAKINTREVASGPKERELAGDRYDTPWWTDYLSQMEAGPVLPPVQPFPNAIQVYKTIRETVIATITDAKTVDQAITDLDAEIKNRLQE